MNIEDYAKRADGRSHRCEECQLRPCSSAIFEVSSQAFVEGFCKGVKHQKKKKI